YSWSANWNWLVCGSRCGGDQNQCALRRGGNHLQSWYRRHRCNPPALPARDPRVEIVYRPIDQLKPDPRNPRRHERKQIRKIADSIETFGFNVPILVDAELRVIAGHGRLLACPLLGRNEVPTISLEHLSEAQARA